MKFRTEIETSASDFQLSLTDSVFTIGSCFADVMGKRLCANKVNCLTNPFGAVFNPGSLFKLLVNSISDAKVDENLFVENVDDSWNHYDFHSQFRAASKSDLQQKIASVSSSVKEALTNCRLLIITLGTASVYELKSNGKIVSNCHKQPQQLFEKRLLSAQEIETGFLQFYKLVKASNPTIQVLLTVSPVRHTRDGLRLNSVSKSILRMVCHTVSTVNANVSYFPSYEIMMDDLRDYRFYKSDLIHPNEMAEDYIFKKFSETHFSAELQSFITEWERINTALLHRPFNPESVAHQQFLQNLLIKLQRFGQKVNVSEEIEFVKAQLIAN